MKGQVLKPTMSIIIAVIGMLSIMIGLGIFLFVQFVLGGAYAEVVGIDDKAYHISEVIGTYPFEGKKMLEPILQAAIVKRLDDKTASQLSSALNDFLGKYDFSYEVSLPFSEPAPPVCVTYYDKDKHKAVDISASCGTPVKAACGGRLSLLSGISDDPAFRGQEGLAIKSGADCMWPGYRLLYGCLEIPDTSSRPVEKDKTIGFVSTCDTEKELGCHLHFGITKGAIRDEEDPIAVCGSISSVLDTQTNLLARKGDLAGEDVQEFSIPLLFKGKIERLVVKIA